MTLRSIVIPSGGGGGGAGSVNFSAGTASANLGSVVFSNANNVSFGLNGSTITASANAAGGANINLSAGSTSQNLSAFTVAGANGITWGLDAAASVLTGSVQTAYQSQGAYLTTADLSQNSSNYARNWKLTGNSAGTQSSAIGTDLWLAGGNGVTVSGSSNSISFSVATNYQSQGAYLTTAMASNRGSDFVQATAAFAGTNASGTINSTGISVSVAAPGAANYSVGVSNLGNTSGNTGVTGTRIVFAGIGGNTLSQATDANGATVSISGAGYTLSTYEPFNIFGGSGNTITQGWAGASSCSISVWPFAINAYLSAGVLNIPVSMSFVTVGTSTGSQTLGLAYALYTRNVSTLSSIASTSFSIGVSGNNSSYTINQVTVTSYSGYGATGATNSAGVNISSGYTGAKVIGFPVNLLLTPGEYWLGMAATNSTSSQNQGIAISQMGFPFGGTVLANWAPIGSFSTAYSTGLNADIGRLGGVGHGGWTSAGSVTMVPPTMNFASISAMSTVSIVPIMRFWST